jgi:hypothetical protein
LAIPDAPTLVRDATTLKDRAGDMEGEMKSISLLEFHIKLLNARYADKNALGNGHEERTLLQCWKIACYCYECREKYPMGAAHWIEEIDRRSPNFGSVVADVFLGPTTLVLQ